MGDCSPVRRARGRTETTTVRRLRRSEKGELRDHLLRLGPESRRQRFHRAMGDKGIAGYVDSVWGGPGFIEGAFVDGVLRGVAECYPIGDGTEAEVSFSVEEAFRGRGLGTQLFQRVTLRARNQGLIQLTAYFLPQNGAMRALAKRVGAEIVRGPGELLGIVRNTPPTAFSAWREEMADASGTLLHFADVWSRSEKSLA